MALPQRQEYDLEGAAEYLGCSTGDILYYLDKGLLRLSVSTEHSPDFVSVPFEKLSAAEQQLLQSLYNPDGIDFRRIKLDQASLDAGGAVSSLYLTHYQRNKIKDTVHQLGEPIWLFQDFAGEQITIWHEGSLRGFWLYEEGGWIAGTFIAKEELDRLAPKPKAKRKLKAKPAEKSSAGSKVVKPKEIPLYSYPNNADHIARTMTDFMNKYCQEFEQKPSESQLKDYLIEETAYVNFDYKCSDFVFGDEDGYQKCLSMKDFKRRYDRYFS